MSQLTVVDNQALPAQHQLDKLKVWLEDLREQLTLERLRTARSPERLGRMENLVVPLVKELMVAEMLDKMKQLHDGRTSSNGDFLGADGGPEFFELTGGYK